MFRSTILLALVAGGAFAHEKRFTPPSYGRESTMTSSISSALSASISSVSSSCVGSYFNGACNCPCGASCKCPATQTATLTSVTPTISTLPGGDDDCEEGDEGDHDYDRSGDDEIVDYEGDSEGDNTGIVTDTETAAATLTSAAVSYSTVWSSSQAPAACTGTYTRKPGCVCDCKQRICACPIIASGLTPTATPSLKPKSKPIRPPHRKGSDKKKCTKKLPGHHHHHTDDHHNITMPIVTSPVVPPRPIGPIIPIVPIPDWPEDDQPRYGGSSDGVTVITTPATNPTSSVCSGKYFNGRCECPCGAYCSCPATPKPTTMMTTEADAQITLGSSVIPTAPTDGSSASVTSYFNGRCYCSGHAVCSCPSTPEPTTLQKVQSYDGVPPLFYDEADY